MIFQNLHSTSYYKKLMHQTQIVKSNIKSRQNKCSTSSAGFIRSYFRSEMHRFNTQNNSRRCSFIWQNKRWLQIQMQNARSQKSTIGKTNCLNWIQIHFLFLKSEKHPTLNTLRKLKMQTTIKIEVILSDFVGCSKSFGKVVPEFAKSMSKKVN